MDRLSANTGEFLVGEDWEGRYGEIVYHLAALRAENKQLRDSLSEPTEAMWSGLARDLIMWDRFGRPTGADLYRHLKRCGRTIPDWLRKEIPDVDHVPPKGTVAICIWKAMAEVLLATNPKGE